MRPISTLAALVLSLACLCAQATKPIDWERLFTQAISTDEQDQNQARRTMLESVLPQVCGEEATLASNDIEGLNKLYESDIEKIRLQVSAVIVGFVTCRSDSETVLSMLLPTIIRHAQEPSHRIAQNSVNTLTLLTPSIPSEALEALIKTMQGPETSLAVIAAKGVARTAVSSPRAAEALKQALIQDRSASLQIAAAQAVSLMRLTNPGILSALSNLLESTDSEVVRTALQVINQLGGSAIDLNRHAITLVAEKFAYSDTGKIAGELLAR